MRVRHWLTQEKYIIPENLDVVNAALAKKSVICQFCNTPIVPTNAVQHFKRCQPENKHAQTKPTIKFDQLKMFGYIADVKNEDKPATVENDPEENDTEEDDTVENDPEEDDTFALMHNKIWRD